MVDVVLGWGSLAAAVVGTVIAACAWKMARNSNRSEFLAAHGHLFALRERLFIPPASTEAEQSLRDSKILDARSTLVWVTWGTYLACHRASFVWRAASERDRQWFLGDLGALIVFHMKVPGWDGAGALSRLHHLTMACKAVSNFIEMEGESGEKLREQLTDSLDIGFVANVEPAVTFRQLEARVASVKKAAGDNAAYQDEVRGQLDKVG